MIIKISQNKDVSFQYMHFCPNCGNMLWPRRKKLYCKICNEEFDLQTSKNDYKLIKIIQHDESEGEPIIIKIFKRDRTSWEDRNAYEQNPRNQILITIRLHINNFKEELVILIEIMKGLHINNFKEELVMFLIQHQLTKLKTLNQLMF